MRAPFLSPPTLYPTYPSLPKPTHLLPTAHPQTRALGFLDEQNFHLDNDEHDLILRAHAAFGVKAARFAVGFYMPKKDSTTRKFHKLPPLGRWVGVGPGVGWVQVLKGCRGHQWDVRAELGGQKAEW